jgi:hypothetical protein
MSKVKLLSPFLDTGEEEISHNEDLVPTLRRLSEHGNIIVTFEKPGLFNLTVGIGKTLGFVEYMNADREPPYIIATKNVQGKSDQYIDFDSNGTQTPIADKFCLPISEIFDIVTFIIENSVLPKNVDWENV